MQTKDLSGFRRKPYRMKRLDEYFKRMSKLNDKIIYDDNVADMLAAQGFEVEEDPRSIYDPERLFIALSMYAPGRVQNPVPTEHYQAGLALARACFKRPVSSPFLEMMPANAETIFTITRKPTASAGLTAYGCTKAEAMTRGLERGMQTLLGEKAPEPCLAFARTQFGRKTRLVWGYPYSMTFIEGLIAYPMLKEFKRRRSPMAFATKTIALGTRLRVAAYHKKWAYSIDMSSFDASLSTAMIHEAFKILRTWFDPNQYDTRSGLSTKQVFDLIERYFLHTPIVMPDGFIYHGKKHGVPSGSYFTSIIDSIVNVIIAGTIASRFKLNVDKRDIFVLGDDLLIWSNRDISLETLASFASKFFGVEFHPQKSMKFQHTEVIHFLGRDWDKGVPDLPVSGILKRMVYPERFRKYSSDPAERKREVSMLIASYAAVYRSAWKIAKRLLGSPLWWQAGCTELDVAAYGPLGGVPPNPEHLSGLERYMELYIRPKVKGDLPNTILQFWS